MNRPTCTGQLPRLLLILLGGTLLLGADCLGALGDDDDGEPVVFATDEGDVGRISGGNFEATDEWGATVDAANRVSVVEDGTQLFVGAASTVSAFPLTSADPNSASWTWSAPDDIVAMAGPGSGAVFVMTTSTLHALSTDGGELWSVDLLLDLSGVSDSALGFSGGDLVLGGDPTRRLDPSSGAVTHTLATGSSDVSGVVVSGGFAYLATATGVLAARSSDLVEQWFHATSAEVDAVASSGGSVAYAVRGGVVGLLAAGGNPVFDTGADTGVFDALGMAGNLVVAARADGTLIGWDEVDGEQVWLVTAGGPVGGLGLTEITAYYGHGSDLEALSLSDGGTLWTLTTTGNPVAVLPL